jgi:hypothetical protein
MARDGFWPLHDLGQAVRSCLPAGLDRRKDSSMFDPTMYSLVARTIHQDRMNAANSLQSVPRDSILTSSTDHDNVSLVVESVLRTPKEDAQLGEVCHVFSPDELPRLGFVRWLLESERLVP